MGRGGSEATTMWALQALQERCRVTFTTSSPFDAKLYNTLYGTSVDPDQINFLPAPRLPGVRSGEFLTYWQRALFDRFCRNLGKHFDACISTYNPADFGRPGIQLLGDFSFNELSRRSLYSNAEDRFCHRQSLLRRAYLLAGDRLRGSKEPSFAERGDCAVANSSWNADQLEALFGLSSPPVLYPPCNLFSPLEDALSNGRRDPLRFACLGRLSPEKEIEKVINILDRVRTSGQSVRLDLIGEAASRRYGRKIRNLVSDRRSWIETPGFLDSAAKARYLKRQSFAIHGCQVESFGVAVAEMTSAGLIPFVPAQGATREIALLPELIYETESDAVSKILTLLKRPEGHAAIRRQLVEQTRRFSPEQFMAGFLDLVQGFLGCPLPSPAPLVRPTPASDDVAETRPAPH